MSQAGACLIAGCGDVGARLGSMLVAHGETVYGLRRSDAPLPAGMRPVRADLTQPDSLAELPPDIRRVVFLPTPGARDEAAYRDVFFHGLHHLVDALQRQAPIERLLFVSSSAVYGEHGGAWVDEDTACAPLAFNGRLLLQAEQWLQQHVPTGVVARCAGIYGPGRTRLIDQVVQGTARIAAGAAEFTNRIHVDDVAAALAHLLALPSVAPCYNLCDDEPATLGDVQRFLAQRLGLPAPPPGASGADRAVGNKRLCNKRLRNSGWSLQYPDFRIGYASLIGPLAPAARD